VGGLRPRRILADRTQRRAILQATLAQPGELWFGVALTTTRSAVYLTPQTGQRSLVVPNHAIHFTVSWREGAPGPDCRASLTVPQL
jgi:outer membrane usher protein FimD/PapC